MISMASYPRSKSSMRSSKRCLVTRYVLLLFMPTLFDGQTRQIHNMSAEIEAIGSKHTEALAKLGELAGREAELVESLRKAGETHSAEVDVLRVQHAQVL